MNKIYVCSDLHGCFDLYEQINNFILPDDTVIFLGDAIDRGPYSYETMEAIRTNPQWIYLKGNHEAMLEDAINEKLNPLIIKLLKIINFKNTVTFLQMKCSYIIQ